MRLVISMILRNIFGRIKEKILNSFGSRVKSDSLEVSDKKSTAEMEVTNVMEYEGIAKQKLPKMVYDYYASGAEDQWTLAENRNAFSRIL